MCTASCLPFGDSNPTMTLSTQQALALHADANATGFDELDEILVDCNH